MPFCSRLFAFYTSRSLSDTTLPTAALLRPVPTTLTPPFIPHCRILPTPFGTTFSSIPRILPDYPAHCGFRSLRHTVLQPAILRVHTCYNTTSVPGLPVVVGYCFAFRSHTYRRGCCTYVRGSAVCRLPRYHTALLLPGANAFTTPLFAGTDSGCVYRRFACGSLPGHCTYRLPDDAVCRALRLPHGLRTVCTNTRYSI